VKIAAIEAIPYSLPTVRPHKLAMATITEHTLVLVRVHDDEGRIGVGETGIIPHYSTETQHGICQVVEETIAPCLIGRDPTSLETLIAAMDTQVKGNNYTKGAVEMACVDLAARAAGVPAHQLFGGQVRDRIPVLWVLRQVTPRPIPPKPRRNSPPDCTICFWSSWRRRPGRRRPPGGGGETDAGRARERAG
jgi:muconate cycloisomerase